MSTALEATFSAREAAVILGRSYSWLDQRLRNRKFTLPDGTVLQPCRTTGGYRRFDVETIKEIAFCCYRNNWFTTMQELRGSLRRLCVAAYT